MATDKRCGCSKEEKCKQAIQGLIFHRGKHLTPMCAATWILKQPCWRGATVTTENGFMVARKGTAEMRLNVPSAGVVAAENVRTETIDALRTVTKSVTHDVTLARVTDLSLPPEVTNSPSTGLSTVPPVSCVVVPFRPRKPDLVEVREQEMRARVDELEAAIAAAEERAAAPLEPWRCMECGKEGLSAMPKACPSCNSSRLTFDYGRPKAPAKVGKQYSGFVEVNEAGQRITMYRGPRNACRWYDVDSGEQVGPEQSNVAPAMAWAMAHGFQTEDFARRELMAQKWNPPRDEYSRSSVSEEQTMICRNPFAEVAP